MKAIRLFIEDICATPANTLGMGGVDINGGPDMLPMNVPQKLVFTHKKKKKMKSLRDYLIRKRVKNDVEEKDLNGEYI